MVKLFKIFLRLVFGILLGVLALASSITFQSFFSTLSIFDLNIFQFFYGAGAYVLFHVLVMKPDRIYVFGHELTHALAAILCGAKVSGFRVSKDSGHVKLSKSNFFIELAPYFIPLYTIVLFVLYFCLSYFFHIDPKYHRYYISGIGVTIAFHIVMTVDALKANQPDLHNFGIIMSLLLIYATNLGIIAFIISIVVDKSFIGSYIGPLFVEYIDIFQSLFRQLFL